MPLLFFCVWLIVPTILWLCTISECFIGWHVNVLNAMKEKKKWCGVVVSVFGSHAAYPASIPTVPMFVWSALPCLWCVLSISYNVVLCNAYETARKTTVDGACLKVIFFRKKYPTGRIRFGPLSKPDRFDAKYRINNLGVCVTFTKQPYYGPFKCRPHKQEPHTQ